MVDAGFEKRIDRPTDAARWSLGVPNALAAAGDWVATAVPAQRAVTITPGQARIGQILIPGTFGQKTASTAEDPHTLQLTLTGGGMPVQGKLICRELIWTGTGEDMSGLSRFVILDAGGFSAVPALLPDYWALADGLERVPGERYLEPLFYAVIEQSSNTVRLWDLWLGSRPVPQLLTPQNSQWNFGSQFSYDPLHITVRDNIARMVGVVSHSLPVGSNFTAGRAPAGTWPRSRKPVNHWFSGRQVPREVWMDASGYLRFNAQGQDIPGGTLCFIDTSWEVG